MSAHEPEPNGRSVSASEHIRRDAIHESLGGSTVATPLGVLAIVPDASGNDYVTFGDGTGAVHTADGWWMVAEADDGSPVER